MKLTLKDAYKFDWDGLKGWAYNSKEDFPDASAAYFEVTGRHGKVKTASSDRVYYVLDGKGVFEIGGKEVEVEKTDVVIVPKNTPYDYWAKEGGLKLFLVHTPAYNPEDEVKFE